MAEENARITAAAKAIEDAMSQGNWALRAAASTVGIERAMSTNEMVAWYLASKALAAVDALEPPAARWLDEYEERLQRAVGSLTELLHQPSSDAELQRLIAKRSGVELALSYLVDFCKLAHAEVVESSPFTPAAKSEIGKAEQ